MICPICGGRMEGDGHTTAFHCESVDLPLDREPDCAPLYCIDMRVAVLLAWRRYTYACLDMRQAHQEMQQAYFEGSEIRLIDAQNRCHYYAEMLFGYALLDQGWYRELLG